MTILSRGAIRFETSAPLDFAAATRFAKCCQANAQYQDVAVRPHPRQAGRFVVSYQPTDPAREAKLLAAQQGSRAERAEAQADCYDVQAVPGGHQVLNLLSGACYLVSHSGACDCPDAHYRTGALVRCKHALLAEQAALQAREEQLISSVDHAKAQRIAAARARINEDFPAFD